jgi:putative SOS response-associated peptidase YedK
VAAIHDRMPVIVPTERYDAWLDAAKVNAVEAAALIGPAPNDFLRAYAVSTRVNSYQNDGPENLEPASPG